MVIHKTLIILAIVLSFAGLASSPQGQPHHTNRPLNGPQQGGDAGKAEASPSPQSLGANVSSSVDKAANDLKASNPSSEMLTKLMPLIEAGLVVGILAFLGNAIQALAAVHSTREARKQEIARATREEKQEAAREAREAKQEAKHADIYLRCLAIDLKVLTEHLENVVYDLEDMHEPGELITRAAKKAIFVPIADTICSSWNHLTALSPFNASKVRSLSADLTRLSAMLETLSEQEADEHIQLTQKVLEDARAIKLDSDIDGLKR
jgi:hypothetical protein